ncbi:MAG: FHA domain-containing protein [Planctomycetota bacterium]
MYTLQILDAGQTFLHALDARATTFGSGSDADVRLHEEGVELRHATLEPTGSGVQLEAAHDVVVNGVTTRAATLSLGDRVEIGKAVLVVGKTVARKAEPEDVLTRALPRTHRTPRRSARPTASKTPKVVAALVALLVIGGVVAGVALRDGGAEAKGLVAMVDSLRERGKLAEAREESARLRGLWREAGDDRLARLDEADAALDAVDRARAQLRARVLDPAEDQTYAQWSRELRRLEERGRPDQRVAARKVRSRLRQLLTERRERVAAAPPVEQAPKDAPAQAPETPEGATPPTSSVTAAVASAQRVEQAELDRRCEQGKFAQALALVQAGFETADSAAEVARLRGAQSKVRVRAERAMATLLAEAARAEREGSIEHAVAVLQSARHDFPSEARFAALGNELARLEALELERQSAAAGVAAAAPATASGEVDQAARLQTLASLRSHMDKVRDADEAGDYARAAALLRDAAAAVRARDGEFADRLVTRAAESELLAGWNDAVVAAVAAGKELTTVDLAGRELQLLRIEGGRVVARSPDGDAPLDWFEVGADGMQRLATALRAKGRTALGLAALLYKNGEAEAAEAVLADVVREDAKRWRAKVDEVIARGRGEEASSVGYELRKGVFVSLRQVELEGLAKSVRGRLDAALRARDPNAADAFVAATVAEGALQREALGLAVRGAFDKRVEQVQRSALRKQVDKLTLERDALDEARDHAKELIFDSQKYFYPYKPPAVSGEKHAEYNRVQQEVDARVAALRAVWRGSKTKLKVSAKFGDQLARIDWLAEQQARLGALPKGESVATVLHPLAWARALEPGETLTLQTFALTPSERAQFETWRRVRAYNEAAKDEWPVAVTTLLRITNDYRVMFGHRPLAAVASACEGSQGHADEMSRLGYFAHMSPTPGRKTPTDRMRLAGYMFGVSENIAMTGGALSSHVAWCHSSGHHRNLLSPGHREIGIGANGRYWVQNFGSGDVHKSHPLYAATEAR